MGHRPHCSKCGKDVKMKRLYVRKSRGDSEGTNAVGWLCRFCGSVHLDSNKGWYAHIEYKSPDRVS